jgi:hypothetical protein
MKPDCLWHEIAFVFDVTITRISLQALALPPA